MSERVVVLDNVTKRFRRGAACDSMVDVIASGLGRLFSRRAKGPSGDWFAALDGASFSVSRGEAVGLIGANAAGKSTALKLIARILRADRGEIRTNGRVTALIEIGAGFHGDLTGRENIYLNAAILGMRRGEIDRKFDAIVDFTGISEFIDTPVKRYSSGMQARLGFSVAAHVDPDLLLVDEVLSVGDVLFRQRCLQRMRELVSGGAGLLLVTHQLDQLQSFSHRTVVLDHGKVVHDGETGKAVGVYLSALQGATQAAPNSFGSKRGRVDGLAVRNGHGREVLVIRPDEVVEISTWFELVEAVDRLNVEIEVQRDVGSMPITFSSIRDEVTFSVPSGRSTVRISAPSLPLAGGQYFLRVLLQDVDTSKVVADSGYRFPIAIDDGGRATGTLCLPHEWELVRPASTGTSQAGKRTSEPGASATGQLRPIC